MPSTMTPTAMGATMRSVVSVRGLRCVSAGPPARRLVAAVGGHQRVSTPRGPVPTRRAAVQRLAHRGDHVEERALLAELVGAGGALGVGAEPHRHDLPDASGPGRHHDDPVGEEHRLGDRVRHEHDGGARLGRDAHELGLHLLARHLVERAERLVHEQQPGLLGERAGDRDALLHAARELVGVAVGEVGEADHLEQLGHAGRAGSGCHAVQFERQRDVRGDRAPRQQPRRLERDAVLLVESRLPGGLAEHRERAARRARRGRRSGA